MHEVVDALVSGRTLRVSSRRAVDRRTGICEESQPEMCGVTTVRIDTSGQWLIVFDAESWQTTMRRIHPDTEMIIIDLEEQ
jgi:hypothetical protein